MPSKKSNPAKRSMNKKKSTARQHAGQRVMRQMNEPYPDVPQSTKEISQSRFPGETPLTGEDRPVTRPRGKQHGFRGPKLGTGDFEGVAAKKFVAAPPKKRRPTSRDRNR
jgi:hypothetical protein